MPARGRHAAQAEHSPYVYDHFPNRVFFGDTHLHTSWATDAVMACATLGPDEAYRVSRGEEVRSYLGWRVKLNRPLDFLVVADHAENLGLADFIRRSDPILLSNEQRRPSEMVLGLGLDSAKSSRRPFDLARPRLESLSVA